ncbi:MAG: hypothetical protein ACREFE_08680 [Limisphaerales bacterium]
MAIKRANSTADNNTAQQQPNNNDHSEFEFRENPRINAQIDNYKKQFPDKWAFIKSMSRERLERALVLAKMRSHDLREKLDRGVLRKVENNEEFKRACEAVIQLFPENEREQAKINLAKRIVFSQAKQQRKEQKQGVAMAA